MRMGNEEQQHNNNNCLILNGRFFDADLYFRGNFCLQRDNILLHVTSLFFFTFSLFFWIEKKKKEAL